jgi:hypothetical protein
MQNSPGIKRDSLPGTKPPSPTTKPTSKARKAFEAVSRLPRRQQDKIVEVVEAMIEKHSKRPRD